MVGKQTSDGIVPINNGKAGVVTGGGVYSYFQEVSLSATPTNNFVFVAWREEIDGALVSVPGDVFMAENDRVLHATFMRKHYTIDLSQNNQNGGTVEGSGTYEAKTEKTIKATPAEGFDFLYWKSKNEIYSDQPELTFNGTDDVNLVAYFSTSVSVNSHQKLALLAYPNPAKGFVTIKASTLIGIADRDLQFNLLNNKGSQHNTRAKRIAMDTFELDINELNQGSYVLKVQTNNKLIGTCQIVVIN